MTLRIHAPNPLRVGETKNVLVTSDNPGVVSLTYGAGLTGPATVEIEGTRVWRMLNPSRTDGWNAPAAASEIIKVRHGTTIGVEFDLINLLPYSSTASSITSHEDIVRSYQINTGAIGYALQIRSYNGSYNINLLRGTQVQALFSFATSHSARILRFTLVFPPELATQIDYRYSIDGGAITLGSVSPAAIAGELATCATLFHKIQRFFYAPSALPPAQQDLFLGGAFPTDACTVQYGGTEEDATRVYDASGNDYDSIQDADALRPMSQIVRTYTDTVPVVPYALVPVTAVSTTGTTIDATRPRQGVPARASEAERIETADQCTVTVEAALVSIGPDTDATVAAYPADVYLQVCATPDGTVSLASDDPNLTVDATVEIVGGSGTITAVASADVTGATITATYGATTDAATVSVTEAPEPEELLAIGPDVVAEVESYPDAIILLLTSNADGDAEITSDNENLIPVSPVTVIDGKAEVACLVTADVSGATITASRDPGPSDSCSVTVSDVLAGDWIAVGPNQRTRIEGKRIVWPIRVRSSKDGAFTATADPATGIIIAGPFELASGACDITAQPTQAGTWTLTVEQDGRTDSVTLEALPAAAIPAPRQYNLSAEIDAFFDFINRKHGFRPRFTPANVQDVRAEHATDRTYSRYAQGTGQPGSVFGAVALSYQVMISYSSVTMAEQDLGILREEADRYGWNAIGFSMTGQTMFEPIKMMPRLTLTMNFDIIPQGR